MPRSLLAALLLFGIAAPAAASWDDGVQAFRAGDFVAAERAFASWTESRTEVPNGYYVSLGLCRLRRELWLSALEPLQRAVALAPDGAEYRLALAQTLLRLERSAAAWEQLVAVAPRNLGEEPLRIWSELLARAARELPADEVTAVLERAVAVADREKALWVALARSAGDPERAFAAAERALALDPADEEMSRWTLGKALDLAAAATAATRASWLERAVVVARRWLGASPSPAARLALGQALMGVRRYEEAAAELASAAEGSGALAWLELARCELALERAEAALTALERALALDPDAALRTAIAETRGRALRHLRRFAAAAEAFRGAGNATEAAAMEQLAAAQELNEQWERDREECLQRLAELDDLERERDLAGTEAWEELRQTRQLLLRRCRAFLVVEEEATP